MADFTRFDFNAKNFLTSESVRRMTDAEVGQYVLLLAEAWLCGKDTTLPDDLPYLARLAHTTEVSPRVLDKFPVVDTTGGQRRRNDVLYGEWLEAQGRSAKGRANANRRWESDDEESEENKNENPAGRANATGVLLHLPPHKTSIGNTDARTVPYQAVPDQTEPNRTANTSGGADFSTKGKNSKGDWANLRRPYRHAFGKKPDSTRFRRKYEEACLEFSEEIVLGCFQQWATTVGDTVKGYDNPLYVFFKKLPELAADEIESKVEEKELAAQEEKQREKQAQETATIEENVRKQKQADWEFMNKAPAPENGGSPLEYLAEIETTQ